MLVLRTPGPHHLPTAPPPMTSQAHPAGLVHTTQLPDGLVLPPTALGYPLPFPQAYNAWRKLFLFANYPCPQIVLKVSDLPFL